MAKLAKKAIIKNFILFRLEKKRYNNQMIVKKGKQEEEQ